MCATDVYNGKEEEMAGKADEYQPASWKRWRKGELPELSWVKWHSGDRLSSAVRWLGALVDLAETADPGPWFSGSNEVCQRPERCHTVCKERTSTANQHDWGSCSWDGQWWRKCWVFLERWVRDTSASSWVYVRWNELRHGLCVAQVRSQWSLVVSYHGTCYLSSLRYLCFMSAVTPAFCTGCLHCPCMYTWPMQDLLIVFQMKYLSPILSRKVFPSSDYS